MWVTVDNSSGFDLESSRIVSGPNLLSQVPVVVADLEGTAANPALVDASDAGAAEESVAASGNDALGHVSEERDLQLDLLHVEDPVRLHAEHHRRVVQKGPAALEERLVVA